MSNWFSTRAPRLLLAASLAFAVGVPTIACTGGGGVSADAAASERIVGTWQVQPNEDDLRQLKIIDAALGKKKDLAKLKKKLKPKMTAAEEEMFKALANAPANSPELKFAKEQLKMMKQARLTITDSKYSMKFGDDVNEWTYKVSKESGDDITLKLDNGEVHELELETNDLINVTITSPQKLELRFSRKKK